MPTPELDESAVAVLRSSTGYLERHAHPALRGRDIFRRRYFGQTQQTLLINETTARSMWPGEDPIGKRVSSAGLIVHGGTVVGVVAGVHHSGSTSLPPCSSTSRMRNGRSPIPT